MKILFYDMGSYTYTDIKYHLEKMGHTCKTVFYHFADRFHDDFFCERFESYLKADDYDAVMSVNFFPLVAKLCNENHIKYISWSYDSPLAEGLSRYFGYETNYIFLFDRIEVEEYRAEGYDHVFHLPLAVNTVRLDSLQYSDTQIAHYGCDVSLIGHLYNSPLDTLLYSTDEYTRGYIEAILQTQLRVYGYYYVDDMISDELLQSINESFKKIGQYSVSLNRRGLSYAIASRITHMERSFLLEQMGELFDTRFYTTAPCEFDSPVKICGPVKYYTEMPAVFRYSRLNLNPTLKSIRSGIPLRALDIMGSGGVLFSNYQLELAEYFENERDVIMYESMEDAFSKADFYLKHDDLLKEIAQNGYKKVKEAFSYPDKLQEMFKTANLTV